MMRARVARRSAGARFLAALARVTEPHVLFPLVALLILSIIWGATFRIVKSESADARGAAVASAQDLLATYEAQIVRALREIDQTLKVVQYAAETKGFPLALTDLQERTLLPPNLLFVVSLTDARGKVVASTAATHADNVTEQDTFVSLRDKPPASRQELSVDRPRHDPPSNEWRLHFSRRLNGRDGAFAGIVTVAVDASYFVSGYEPGKLGEHGLLGLLGTDGVFRVRRTGDAVSAGNAVNYGAMVTSNEGDDEAPVSLAVSPWDGVRRYTSTRELYEFPVAVIVGLSEQEQLATTSRNSHLYLQRAAIASIVVILISAILGRSSWQLLQSRRREGNAKIAHAERVEYLAYHDGLTGLPNRSLFSKMLAHNIKRSNRYTQRLAVLFLDLDRFKQINDTLGHEAGDQLLQEVARRLQASLRDSDTVARLGGDEFVVLLPELGLGEYAALVAQKILTVLSEPFSLAGQEFRVTASIGICTYPEDGEDEQTLTKHADIAMYQAKEEGKNNFQFYSEKLNANSLERLTLESSLRHALERQEF
ncbi:MAG TPA: sensor domain-containing diguanylate cyclase, partial [Steroidobacteraceae bacterium]